MAVSRLGFIKGIFASMGLGALGGGRLFAAPPGWTPPKGANLVFGVVSDTHLRTMHGSSGRPGRKWTHKYFAAALAYFREQNVDAVVHCGDFAHRGQVEEMRFHAGVWNRIFPKNRAPDGHEVVKLFVTGNHDTEAPITAVSSRTTIPIRRCARNMCCRRTWRRTGNASGARSTSRCGTRR